MKKTSVLRCLILLLFIFFIADLFCSAYVLETTHYTISNEKINQPVRCVLLSDLHGKEFGKNNYFLVKKISRLEPDIICIPGDLANKSETINIPVKLIEQLNEIAPVYISLGNHEIENQKSMTEEVIARYQSAGATILDSRFQLITLNGNEIQIGGYYGYGSPDEDISSENPTTVFLRNYQCSSAFKLLLCHIPLAWYYSGSLDFWDVDLVLCGHTHGGQIRFPFIGGLYAPDREFFPGKEKGIYESEDHKKAMVLTTGLGNTERIPRFNNMPEVVALDLVPGKE